MDYQALRWEKSRRMVVRERMRQGRDNRGKKLFDLPDYAYSDVLTNMDDDAVEVWRFHNGRADVENRIEELRYDFETDGFCLDSFFGTGAALRLIALNLVRIRSQLHCSGYNISSGNGCLDAFSGMGNIRLTRENG